MATETWTYDGVNLSNYASGVMINDIRTWNGLDNIPGVNVSGSGTSSSTGTNGMFQLAQTHGEFWFPQYYTASTKLMSIFVSSNQPGTGNAPTSVDQGRQYFDQNLDALTLLFSRRRNLASLVRQLSGGTSRLALVTVDSVIEPQLVPVTNALLTVELTLPDGFWRDTPDSTLVATFAPGTGTMLSGATAPMNDLEFDITGPITNPKVQDNESGSWFQYNGTVAATNVLKVFNTTMNISGTGFTPSLVNMQHAGDSNWLTLYPTAINNGANVTFSGTGTSGATNLAVIGHKKYMR